LFQIIPVGDFAVHITTLLKFILMSFMLGGKYIRRILLGIPDATNAVV
jgi:hypothetical protein